MGESIVPTLIDSADLWHYSQERVRSWGLPSVTINPSNGFVTISGCWGRSGVQVYLDEDGQPFGRYRDGVFIEALGTALVNAPVVVNHKGISQGADPDILHGWVSKTWTLKEGATTYGFCEVILSSREAIDEVHKQLSSKGECYLPLSPAYSAPREFKSGEWLDNDGIYSLDPKTYTYTECHVTPIEEVNHLSIVDFGRGGPLAGLYGKAPITDSLYPYPSRSAKRSQYPTKEDDSMGTDTEKEMKDMLEDMLKDALSGVMKDMMQDMMQDMQTSMDGYQASMKESADALSTALSGLVAAIKESYAGSEHPAAHQEQVDQKTQKAGEAHAFIFDSADTHKAEEESGTSETPSTVFLAALDSLVKIAESTAAAQEAQSKRLDEMEARQKQTNGIRSSDQMGWGVLDNSHQTHGRIQITSDKQGNSVINV